MCSARAIYFLVCGSSWLHGDCVGISTSQRLQLEENDEGYLCPLRHPQTRLPSLIANQDTTFIWGSGLASSVLICWSNITYSEVVHWKQNSYTVPPCKAGYSFIEELSSLFKSYSDFTSLEMVASYVWYCHLYYFKNLAFPSSGLPSHSPWQESWCLSHRYWWDKYCIIYKAILFMVKSYGKIWHSGSSRKSSTLCWSRGLSVRLQSRLCMAFPLFKHPGCFIGWRFQCFNSLNRRFYLHSLHFICPPLTVTLTNMYREALSLFIDGECLLSEEGTTQGDTLVMAMHALSTVLLIQKLATRHSASHPSMIYW